ncbi:MAG TPA: hypothetical protein VFW77_00835 [Candidatus Saccharimonadales bacterium]|nr:hypothetical protein [Candidatus Saccharimonadales bacterium]
MENQVITPTQNNPASVSPEPTPPVSPPTPLNPPISPDISMSPGSGKSGWLSLAFSALAVGIFILLVFVTGLVNSLTKAYVWFFVILALGVAGLVVGLISEKNRERISLTGLLGIILSVIVCVNCLVVGSYYIKLQMELNKFNSTFNNSNSSQNSDYNLSTN